MLALITIIQCIQEIDRSSEPKYNIMLLDHPDDIFLQEEKVCTTCLLAYLQSKQSQIVSMTHPKTKIQYHCVIPVVNQTDLNETEQEATEMYVKTLLTPLSSACLYRVSK